MSLLMNFFISRRFKAPTAYARWCTCTPLDFCFPGFCRTLQSCTESDTVRLLSTELNIYDSRCWCSTSRHYCNVLCCIQVFIQRPSTAIGKQRRFWFNQLQEKRQVLRSDKVVERLDDKREARVEGGRRFQREGAITQKIQTWPWLSQSEGQKAPACPWSVEDEGMWKRSEVGGVTEIFRCHPHLGLKNNKQNFIFNASRDWKPMKQQEI